VYSEKVLDHFTNPRNVGEIENADAVAEVGSPVCGDSMKLFLKIKDGVIEDVKFKTFGCGAAIASSSMATEMVKGKSIDEAMQVTSKAIVDSLGGLPDQKIHCSVLAIDALKKALEEYKNGKGKES